MGTGKCNVTGPHHFHPYGVPDNSTFLFDSTVGVAGRPGEFVTIASFESKWGNDTFFVDVSEPSCFPHAFVGIDSQTKKQYIDSTDFFDGREGVANDRIFDIPLACKVPPPGK